MVSYGWLIVDKHVIDDGYNWLYLGLLFYKWGFVSSYNWYNSGHFCVDFPKLVISRLSQRSSEPEKTPQTIFVPRPMGMPQEPWPGDGGEATVFFFVGSDVDFLIWGVGVVTLQNAQKRTGFLIVVDHEMSTASTY